MKQTLKTGLHILVAIAEHVCDAAPEGISELSTHRLQIFLAKDQYLSLLERYRDQVQWNVQIFAFNSL